jgi:hypothetical protein
LLRFAVAANRVFVPQDALDRWLSEERVEVDGETMTLKPEGQQFRLKSAVRFMNEVGGAGDEPALVGKVKDLEQLATMGGEHYADSVLLGDAAYEVIEGFVGEPVAANADLVSGDNLASAARAATGDATQQGEIDLLARFFLSSR